MKGKRTKFTYTILQQMSAMEERLSRPEFHNVLEDLIDFTGLKKKEVLFRIIRKHSRVWGAKGWFNSEFDWHNPATNRELGWFYIAAQSYVFSNSRRPHWEMLEHVKDGPVLDYGCGIGQNVIELASRGFAVCYIEMGLLQQEFLKFRIVKHRITNAFSLNPWATGKLDVMGSMDVKEFFGTILLQHVLEHIPKYQKTLKYLISTLKQGGRIIEHSPFGKSKKNSKYPKMHLNTKIPIKKAMVGMKKIYGGNSVKFDAKVWEKINKKDGV